MSSYTPHLRIRPKPQSNLSIILRYAYSIGSGSAFATVGLAAVDSYLRKLHEYIPDDRIFFVVVSFVIHQVLYLGVNGAIYYAQRNGWLDRFRIDRGNLKGGPPEELVRRTLKESIGAHFIGQPLGAYFVLYPLMVWRGSSFGELPSHWYNFALYACSWMMLDLSFYWVHRAFHSELLYRYHKQHHQYLEPVAFSAEYAHPLEQIFANTLPTVFLAIYSGMHFHAWFVWLFWRLAETYDAHSGLDIDPIEEIFHIRRRLGFCPSTHAQYHDFHHTKNFGNFASEFMDHWFGTQDAWLEHLEQKGEKHSAAGAEKKPNARASSPRSTGIATNGHGTASPGGHAMQRRSASRKGE